MTTKTDVNKKDTNVILFSKTVIHDKFLKSSFKIAFLYIFLSFLWILFSDSLLKILKLNYSLQTDISIIKGWLFVIVTGIMLYLMIDGSMKKLRMSEEELRKKDEMYRLVINGTTNGIWDWDADTNKVYISSNLIDNASGNRINKVLNIPDFWDEFVHPEDVYKLKKEISSYVNRLSDKLCCESRVKVGDKFIWAQIRGQGIWNDKGEIVKIIGTHTNITEQKEIEEKLKKVNDENIKLLNEVIENDRHRTDFLINVSHEFRTPLNVILGSIQLMESYKDKSRCSDEVFDKLFKHITVIRQNCYRLLKIINNFIDITKIDSGYLELNLESCNIVEIVEKAALSVAEFTESNGMSLIFDTEIEEKNIVCDINKIERIILNLISNAIKYNKREGEILVELSEIGESILITVKDTGIGIPEDKKELIFKRFHQVNTSLTREHEGSGIGLSIVKSLVEMHKGEIWVESELGIGSKFFIKLPSNLECSKVKETEGEVDISKRYLYMASIEFSDIYSKK
ncbi:MAG TPA: ATP-binding protein [Clostridia bacterium]